jgi:ectoine hydroxylase-related dioxygenase (phytanoyl-CoA dioxygenase family)
MSEAIELHPWNQGFTWALPATAPRTLSAAEVLQFDQQGYVIIEDVMDAATVTSVTEEIDAFMAEVEADLADRPGGRDGISELGAITFADGLLPESPLLRRLSRNEQILGICLDLLGPDVNVYWDNAVYKDSRKPRRFPWHQDSGYGFVQPQHFLTFWIALNEAHVNNGCPWIVPGLHTKGTFRHRFVEPLGFECFQDAPEAVPAEVPAGGALVLSSLTPHFTAPNISGAVRKAYMLQYAVAGTNRYRGNPGSGAPTDAVPADDPDLQYPVLRGGRPV